MLFFYSLSCIPCDPFFFPPSNLPCLLLRHYWRVHLQTGQANVSKVSGFSFFLFFLIFCFGIWSCYSYEGRVDGNLSSLHFLKYLNLMFVFKFCAHFGGPVSTAPGLIFTLLRVQRSESLPPLLCVLCDC